MHASRGDPGVERDFRGYLECGILAHGFARARCAETRASAIESEADTRADALVAEARQ